MNRILLLLLLPAILTAQLAPEVEITAEPHHHLALTNDQVRVFTVNIPPHSETLLHRHRHDYIYVTLGDSEMVNAVQGKDPVTVKLRDGQTGFLPSSYAHIARNLSNKPFRNVTVELLQDDKLRHSSFTWHATRGLEILPGGTQEILFVKDAVRASEFELQPGGMVPLHHHTGPHLAVALSDLKFRGQVEGKAASEVEMKSGETLWIKGGYSHTLTNIGKEPAKWVTLEFPSPP
jgi:oxalate decarboxylase/phosphoglucose isomerase-like protein (cupin superfamily)